MERDEKDLKRYRRGIQFIIAKRVSKNKWKVEYFVGRRLRDSAGIAEEEFAKVLLSELAVIHTVFP